jgi:site-specific DNA recombinase
MDFPALRADHIRKRGKTNTGTKTGAVLYLRVSTEEQASNFSIGTQEKACRRYCEQLGYRVLEVFQEAASAKTVHRPQFQAMRRYCHKHSAQVAAVVVYAVSRFARDAADHLTVKKELLNQGIGVFSVTERFDSTPAGNFMSAITGAAAEYDNAQRTERTIAGMTAAIHAGKWVWKAPVGYINASVDGGLLPDPVMAPLVRKAFELYAAGQMKAAILETLVAQGLRSSQTGAGLSAQTLDKMLRSPIYAGWIVSSWGITLRGKFQPIIDDDLLKQVQTRLSGGTVPTAREVHRLHSADFPLRVFIKCAGCGEGITGSFATGRSNKYPYYFCRKPGCRAVKFSRDALHTAFHQLLYDLIPEMKFMALFEEIIIDVWRLKHAEREEMIVRLQHEKSKLEQRKQRLLDLMVDGTLTAPDYEKQVKRVGTTLTALEKEVPDELASAQELQCLVEFAEWMLNRVAGIWQSASLANKQRIQNAFFPQGLEVSAEGFGTVPSPLFFGQYTPIPIESEKVASPRGFEPLLSP